MAAYEERTDMGPGPSGGANDASLDESYRSIPVEATTASRRFLAFLGPGFLVAVGYMDPGNWATSIAGGSRFGYALLAAVLLSSIMAMLLQALCARFAIATGRDLAEACREFLPRWLSLPLWALAELAIVATDLAEVIGTAIGLQLLFGLPLVWGVIVTALDVFLILYLQSKGFRRLEAFVAAMILVIAVCFVGQLILAQPSVAAMLAGLIPTGRIVTDNQMLYLALGILGATVMPHNLYLHTGILHTRAYALDRKGRERAIRYATIDSTAALGFAFLVNASILVLAAAAFYGAGAGEVEDLTDAHALLEPLLGSSLAPILFAVALLASGLSSTVTATLAGQIVMQGFLKLRLPIVARRLITRGLAIIPAAVAIVAYGEKGAAELLVLSQVVLSLQLPFAVIPLVVFSAQKKRMGAHMPPLWLLAITSIIAVLIVGLNAKLVWDFVDGGF
ncbi:Nramp family divalent metal transporter [Aurantimonas sp. 22II-16-19i]|uniref:Nramp family divalent metal transporter n=1 Tax=Aurantimonas sp. 22II-16-19i TaxID=1317114 RepID=UPI0009F7C56D|nr:Nramp family divalent metal transporter [Aurantimonas sp. 22II-16-19i]ORE92109.1 manganese transport protein MntH [Aurantimonas sp. 22II-16-19i]